MRGYQRRVIFLKNTGSALFEEAYFVMRHDMPSEHKKDDDIVAEANRIIRQNTDHGRSRVIDTACKRSVLVSRGISFVAGCLAGGGFCALVFIIF
jgi:hypothetical protein